MTDRALIGPPESGDGSSAAPPAGARAIDLDSAQTLINRISWIALLLTPLATGPADQDMVAAVVADLDALVGDLRVAAVGADDSVDDPVEHARRVLHHARARLATCWSACLDAGSDPVHADCLAEASRLARAALISVQRGAVR